MNCELKTQTVLLVDDDEDFRYQQRLQLEAAGFTVIEAQSAKEAEELLGNNTIHLAVVDLLMEQADSGFTLCYHLKKKYPNLPIIMVTAVASEAGIDFDARTAEERSWIKADVVLQKPIRFEQLQVEIDALLSD